MDLASEVFGLTLRANISETVLVLLINEQGEKEKGRDEREFSWVLPSGALAGAERSGGERSEPQRSGAAAKAGADPVLASRPDPEVVAKPSNRVQARAVCKCCR